MRRTVTLVLALMLTALCLVLVACGGDSDGDSSGGEASQDAAKADEGASNAADGIKTESRTIGVVNLVKVAPIEANTDELLVQAGKALGWNVKVVDGAGDPQKILAAAQSFVNQNVDALITTSTEASVLSGALEAAKQKGIPTISINGGTTPSPLFTAQYEEDELKMGTQLAEYIKETVEGPQIANLQTTAAVSGKIRDEAFHEVFPPSAFAAEGQITQADPVAETTKLLTSMLAAHPDINVVNAVYDTEVAAASEVVATEGSDARVYSYFNISTTRELLLDESSALEAVSDTDLSHTGAVAMNQLLQYFENEAEIDPEALEEEPLTYRVVTKETAAEEPPFDNAEVLAPYLSRWEEEFPAS
ncbi:MAG: substrate-binding domain-containing protein [Solirubrobacterales bacterium]